MRLGSIALSAVCLPLAVGAQTVSTRDSVITVTSQRTTRVPPNRASFYVVIEGTAETAADAVARVQTKIGPVLDAIRRAAPGAHLAPPIAYGVGPSPSQNGYPMPATPPTNLSRSIIHVELDVPAQVATVAAAALGAGATGITGLTFEATAADSARRAQVAGALEAAHGDAQTMAEALHGKLGALLDVSLGGGPTGIAFASQQIVFDQRFTQPSGAPDVPISTVVTVRYRLER